MGGKDVKNCNITNRLWNVIISSIIHKDFCHIILVYNSQSSRMALEGNKENTVAISLLRIVVVVSVWGRTRSSWYYIQTCKVGFQNDHGFIGNNWIKPFKAINIYCDKYKVVC